LIVGSRSAEGYYTNRAVPGHYGRPFALIASLQSSCR
jgi:hypothetical protein